MTIDPRLIDVILPEESGYPIERQREDTTENMKGAVQDAGAIVTDFPEHLWIEPSNWADAGRDNDKYGTWGVDYLDRYTNQGSGNGGYSTHECTSHCFRACFESCRNRQRRIKVGPPVPKQRLPISEKSASVWISCLSLYAEANPNEWGGANVRQILSIATRRGCLPDKIQPKAYGFKHDLIGTCGAGGVNQSRGKWVSVSNFPDGWKETAKHFRPLEYVFPDTWEQHVCLLLHGFMVGVGREGHSVGHSKYLVAEKVAPYEDSYDVERYDSISRIKKTVGGSYAIISVSSPDDWEKPSG